MNVQLPTGQNIITLAELQEFSKNTEVALTGFFQNNISRASAFCENYCNKGLKSDTYLDYYDGDGTRILLVNQYPIISVSSLQYQMAPTSAWQDFYSGSLTSNILLDYSSGIITLHDTVFYLGVSNIKIQYQAGFSDCPQDLKQVVLEMCMRIFDESKHGQANAGLQNMNMGTGGFTTTRTFTKLDDRWKVTLENYRRSL